MMILKKIKCAYYDDNPGILVIAGDTSSQSVEFWSATNESCILANYTRQMPNGPTVSFVSGSLVACLENTCEIYLEGSWQHLQDTIDYRTFHSSATTKDAVLLIGGMYQRTGGLFSTTSSTEWIPVDGSPATPGPFTVRHGFAHCTIQTSDDVIVVTGGYQTSDFVTQSHLTDGTENPLTSLGQGRGQHACGVYQDTDGEQVSKKL